ncbi:hypothetical protein NE237_029406 [Protea cynaroides]|uniref:Uncharacterized protein n=1 Tax=Protea cynaroides TaxID=273540 RepID=A0A9Q0GS50_9MAGN|nr:hypothetical protein NE237_029406 [Protea cynaroides]
MTSNPRNPLRVSKDETTFVAAVVSNQRNDSGLSAPNKDETCRVSLRVSNDESATVAAMVSNPRNKVRARNEAQRVRVSEDPASAATLRNNSKDILTGGRGVFRKRRLVWRHVRSHRRLSQQKKGKEPFVGSSYDANQHGNLSYFLLLKLWVSQWKWISKLKVQSWVGMLGELWLEIVEKEDEQNDHSSNLDDTDHSHQEEVLEMVESELNEVNMVNGSGGG